MENVGFPISFPKIVLSHYAWKNVATEFFDFHHSKVSHGEGQTEPSQIQFPNICF